MRTSGRVALACVLAAVAGFALSGCSDGEAGLPTAATAASPSLAAKPGAPAPSPLVTVGLAGSSLTLWPFTGADLSGAPVDPVNLLFTGEADVRSLRAALLNLDGDRTALGFPDVFPFNCTWTDGSGAVHAAYSSEAGWTGGAIQLECGPYDPLRFHLRLFEAGDWVIGGVHFEVLIPGTTEHAVLSWELAEQLVVVDFLRSGLLDPAVPLSQTLQINPSPFREIPAVIYNGLPTELKAAIGGPLGSVSNPVPIATDGRATILNVAESLEADPIVEREEFTIEFNQVIPKPFCASGPFDFVLVQGPVHLRQQVRVTPSGNYLSDFHAKARLDVTPVDPSVTPPAPLGETYRARVNEHHKGIVTDRHSRAASLQLQIELPPSGPFRGRLKITLRVDSDGADVSKVDVDC